MPEGYPFTAGYRVVFEKAVLEWNTVNCKADCVFEYDGKGGKQIPLNELPGNTRKDPYEAELLAFVNCLKTGEPFPISVEEARLAVHTVKELCAHTETVDI
jgi:predicted dehydrogenase